MKILSHNVRVWTRDRDKNDSWYWKKRMTEIQKVILVQEPDVLCLQELSYPANKYIPKGYRRVGLTASHPIYVRKGIKTRCHRAHIHFDSVDALIDGEYITIINVHLHWNKTLLDIAMRQMNRRIESALEKGNEVIIGGDFNNGWEKIYEYLPKKEFLLVAGNGPTFKNKKSGHEGCIDYFFTTHLDAFAYNLGFERNGIPLSDHAPQVYVKKDSEP